MCLTFSCQDQTFIAKLVCTSYFSQDMWLFSFCQPVRGHQKDSDHTRVKEKISSTADSYHRLGEKRMTIIVPEFALSMNPKSLAILLMSAK